MQPRLPQRGFTLLELLVVVVIIAILFATALLSTSFTSVERKLEEEARRFAALISYAREEAILQTRDLGMQIEEGEYRFLVLDSLTGRWVNADFDEILRTRKLPESMEVNLWIEGAGFELGDPDAEETDPGELPQVFILSSGEVSPFELILSSEHSPVRVTVTAELDGKTGITVDDPRF